jgi:UDP-N-acetylmuramyl pentapeptide phosphotransferase/UDP-N-acetylglucosamine-1-phosphate transferase
VLAFALALAALSLADDVRSLPVGVRLGSHLLAAVAVVWYLTAPMDAVPFVLLALAVAWITNLYNFMDGSDGLAGGMAVFGFSTYAIVGAVAGNQSILLAGAVVAAAALAFLVFNFHPARIFLGDVGSIPLGFLAAAVGLWGWRYDLWPLWFPLLVFGPFIGDATVTLARRLLRGEKVWQAHREHYYQRIVRLGFGHRAAALIGYAAMLLCGVCALIGRTQAPAGQAIAFGVASAGMAGLAIWVELRWARHGEREGA